MKVLCPLSFPTNTTAAELLKALDGYISEKLKWSFSVGICTDGAAASTGQVSGLTARMKEVQPECISHREMPASRNMPPELNSVLNDAVKVINHIKAQTASLKHRNKMVISREIAGQCLNYENRCKDFSQKRSRRWRHISVTGNGSQNWLTCVTYSPCSMNAICHFRGK